MGKLLCGEQLSDGSICMKPASAFHRHKKKSRTDHIAKPKKDGK